MKLNIGEETQTNCTIQNKAFSIQASPIAFDILSNKLYSNPVLAIVRELLTNAYDSHKAANNLDVSIDVHFPDYYDKNFSIRDYGTGLCKEDIMEMYTTFFSSTKTNTNDFTGCFGLGSKTPFSYAPAFSINSYFNGIKYYFAAVKKDGYPNIYCVKEEETDKLNGLEVIIPTEMDDRFFFEACEYLQYIPEITINSNRAIYRDEVVFETDNFKVYKYDGYHKSYLDNIIIKQGQNTYTINNIRIPDTDLQFIKKFTRKIKILIEVPIGTLSITPSRENLSQEESNFDKLIDLVYKVENELKLTIENNNDLVKNIDSELYDQIITSKYFTHADNVKIQSIHDSNRKIIKIGGVLIDRYFSDNKHSSRNILSHQLIVYTLEYPTKKLITKIKNTIHNHNEEITSLNTIGNFETDNISVISPHANEDSLLGYARELKRIINILNSITEFDLNIQLISLNQFFKKYPNHKIQKTKSSEAVNLNKNIIYELYTLNLKNHEYSMNHKSTDTILRLKSKYIPENTIIVMDDKNHVSNVRFINLINLFICKLNDKKIHSYITKKSNLDIYSNSEIKILIISKSNFRFFKGYAKVNSDEFTDFIRNIDWSFKYILDSKNNKFYDYVRTLSKLKDLLVVNFKGKTQEFIKNTKIYDEIEKVFNRNKKLNLQYLNDNEIEILKYYDLSNDKRLIAYQMNTVIPSRVNTLLSYYTGHICNACLKIRFHTRRKHNKIMDNVHKLYVPEKINILKILKGDNNYVLF